MPTDLSAVARSKFSFTRSQNNDTAYKQKTGRRSGNVVTNRRLKLSQTQYVIKTWGKGKGAEGVPKFNDSK